MDKVSDDILNIGLAFLACATTMLLLLVCQYPLWCYSEEKFKEEIQMDMIKRGRENGVEFSDISVDRRKGGN